MPKHKYGAYAGYREIDGERIYFHSRMEFNYYLYLRWLKQKGEIQDFEYQPAPFDFHKQAKKNPGLWRGEGFPLKRKYQPDFLVIENNGEKNYVETLGKLRRDHNRNFKLLHQLFPEVKLRIVNRYKYKQIEATVSAMIPGWEKGKFKGQEPRFRSRRRIPHIAEIG